MRCPFAGVRAESFSRRVKQWFRNVRFAPAERWLDAKCRANRKVGMWCALLLQVLSLTLPSPGGEGTALGRIQWRLKNRKCLSVSSTGAASRAFARWKGSPNGDLRMITLSINEGVYGQTKRATFIRWP